MNWVEAYRVLLLGITITIVFLHSVCPAQTQMPLQPTPPGALYSPDGVSLNISFAQAFASNWKQGDGDNMLALRILTRTIDERMLGPFKLKSNMQFALGANYRDDSIPENTLRVSDNEIYLEGVFVYPIRWILDPYFSLSLRTPITEGFLYNTYYVPNLPRRTRIANFWDPVTSQQGTGFNFAIATRTSRFDTRIGVALQQIRAHDNTQLTDDYTTLNVKEAYSARSGIELASNAYFQGDSTIRYTGRLGLFGSFNDLSVWTVRWENETVFKLWKAIGLTWTFNVIHDIRYTRRTQFKQSIMLGLIQDF